MEENEAALVVGPTKKRPPQLPTADGLSPKKKPRSPEPISAGAADDDELTRLLEGPEVVPFKVRFVPYPYTWQSIASSPSSSSYITINVGNEESCGSSFSDSDCSVMASVDLGGLNIAGLGGGNGRKKCPDGGAWGGDTREARVWTVKDGGWEIGDWDDLDEALATFIGEEKGIKY